MYTLRLEQRSPSVRTKVETLSDGSEITFYCRGVQD